MTNPIVSEGLRAPNCVRKEERVAATGRTVRPMHPQFTCGMIGRHTTAAFQGCNEPVACGILRAGRRLPRLPRNIGTSPRIRKAVTRMISAANRTCLVRAVCLLAALWTCASQLAAAETSPATRATSQPSTQPSIHWEKWSDDLFARAKREHKFVYLDLEAVWCHWCHVMDDITFRDPEVVRLMGERYIAVKVDQDARPDLSNRYEDYGWPATVVFNADGGRPAVVQIGRAHV